MSEKTAAGKGQGTHVETYFSGPWSQASLLYRPGNVIKGFNGGFITGWEANLRYPTGSSLSCGNSDPLRSCRGAGRQRFEFLQLSTAFEGDAQAAQSRGRRARPAGRLGLVEALGRPGNEATPLRSMQRDNEACWQVPEDLCVCRDAGNAGDPSSQHLPAAHVLILKEKVH